MHRIDSGGCSLLGRLMMFAMRNARKPQRAKPPLRRVSAVKGGLRLVRQR